MTVILVTRALRDFGDDFAAVLLPTYLLALGHSAFEVGVFSARSLLGPAVLIILVGLIGNARNGRRVLLAAARLMVATGLA